MLTVAFLPVYQNPYQHLLTEALGKIGVHVELLDGMPSPVWLLRERQRVQVLHLHWLYGLYMKHYLTPVRLFSFLSRLTLAQHLGFRIVWTVHNILPHHRPFPPMHAMVRRFVVQQADAMIAHCEYGRREILRRFPSQKPVYIVPHGNYAGVHPVSLTSSYARTMLEIGPKQFVYLLLGNISPYKGIESFVDAFQAHGTAHDVVLIAGRNRAPALLRQLEALAADDTRIRVYPGFIADDEMQRFLRAANVMVFCFKEVLTSGSIILGMTHGVPVIAPALGCLPELVTPAAGILYNPHEPSALAGALRQIKQMDTAKMGAEAKRIADSLCWDDIARQTAAIYRKCLG
ncbi:MAG: glycosyltransferase family 4 protein [Anaerolineae bacterium]|jgi:beta-1,4-mannosyltransferase